MNLFEEFYKTLSKKERRIAKKEDREKELAAIRRNKILRRIFFWTIFTILVLTSGILLIKIANQNPYQLQPLQP